jgi:hypothetical protein
MVAGLVTIAAIRTRETRTPAAIAMTGAMGRVSSGSVASAAARWAAAWTIADAAAMGSGGGVGVRHHGVTLAPGERFGRP